MDYTRFFSVLLIVFIFVFIVDFTFTEEDSNIESFREFECYEYLISIKNGKGSNCYLKCENNERIYLPNNVSFEENFKKGDKLIIVRTGFLGLAKKITFQYFNKTIIVKVSDLYNTFIFYILITSLVFYILFLKFFRLQLFQILYGLFVTVDVVILFFYIFLH